MAIRLDTLMGGGGNPKEGIRSDDAAEARSRTVGTSSGLVHSAIADLGPEYAAVAARVDAAYAELDLSFPETPIATSPELSPAATALCLAGVVESPRLEA